MDNLVLVTVARALDQGLAGAVLEEFRQDSRDRFRFRWSLADRVLSTAVSMRPEAPWIARPCKRAASGASLPGSFAAVCRRTLLGARLREVRKPTTDRWLEFRFADERRLVIELAVHGANLVLVDRAGCVAESLRNPRSAAVRLAAGSLYAPPTPPASLTDPFACSADEIDAQLTELGSQGESPFEGIRRHLFGVGTPAANLVCEEALRSGESHGRRLTLRLDGLISGELIPVIEAPEDSAIPRAMDVSSSQLWPWQPKRAPREGQAWFSGSDPTETAGWWYESVDAQRDRKARRQTLARIVSREAARTRQAVKRCEADLRGFKDPDRYRRWAEALLAGLSRAVRVGEGVQVPDPENPDGGDLVVPVPPGRALPKAAEILFGRHRRALRGSKRARERLDGLVVRAADLEQFEERLFEPGWDEQRITEQIRRLRLPIALEPDTRSGREASRRAPPRIEGVRVYYASTGEMILAGKGGRENHRLTFKLAAPHDFWLHALGVPGAHVILRNDHRERRPGPALLEAAAVAAYHSEFSKESAADVQWTLRKNVRKPRGAAPGTVTLKRFETLRVKPRLPG